MEFENTPERALAVPGEVTQRLIDAYSETTIRNIFLKVGKYYARQQEGRLDAHLHLNEHELLFIDKYCSDANENEVNVETTKECVIGKGDKQIKVNLGVLQKMKEKKLMTEVVKPHVVDTSETPDVPTPEIIHNTVNKNAYEIRLDVLKEATKLANGDSNKALQIAENFYSFVENKKNVSMRRNL